MPRSTNLAKLLVVLFAVVMCGVFALPFASAADSLAGDKQPDAAPNAMQIHYLEIVTPDVEATSAALAALQGVAFRAPEPVLVDGRIATLQGGGCIGVRAPLRPDEAPVVRPYSLINTNLHSL